MRNITFIILFISLFTYSQNNEALNDTLVTNLIRLHIDSEISSEKNIRRINNKSKPWSEAQCGLSLDKDNDFETQLADIIYADQNIYSDKKEKFTQIFDQEDLNYMKGQYYNELNRTWNFKFETVKIKKNPRKEFYELSNPLFNKNKKKAIIYQRVYCPYLCGSATIFIYTRENKTWKLYKEITLWVS